MEQTPDLSTLVAYLRHLPKLTANPSYPHNVKNLLMSLDSGLIDAIKLQFQANDQAITLQKFIWLMLHSLGPQQAKNMGLYYELTKLFQDIDIDNSSTIQWSEFLQYLSNSTMAPTPNIEANRVNTQKKVLFEGFNQPRKYRKYPIRKVVELVKYNALAVVNYDHLLEFVPYDREGGKEQDSKQVKLQYVDQSKILSVDYSEEDRMFGVLMSNRNVCFVEDGQIQKTVGVLRPLGTQNDITYLPMHQLWALTSHNSTLQLFPSPKTAAIPHKIIFKPHEQPLTAITEIASPKAVVTASMDGCLKLWQPQAGRLIIELSAWKELGVESEEHKGVKGIAVYSKNSVSFICAWMFTSEVYLWLPSLSLSKPFAGQLRGHMGLVLDCAFTWTGEVASLDDKRSLRVWNPNTLQCLQILTVEQQALKLKVLTSKPYLVAYSKFLTFYRMKTDTRADLEQELQMANKGDRNVLARGQLTQSRFVGMTFSEYYCAVIVATANTVKIMQTNQSKIIAVIAPVREDEEFVMLASKGQRGFFMATSKGNVYEYRVQDGAMVKVRRVNKSPSAQLKFIYYHESSRILLTVVQTASGSCIYTYDEQFQEEQPIKQVQFEQTNLQHFFFSNKFQRFYVLSGKLLTVWNYHRIIMVHKVDMGFIAGTALQMKVEEESGSIVVLTEKEGYVVKMDEVYDIWEGSVLENEVGTVVGGALIRQEVNLSYLQQMQTKKIIDNRIQDRSLKVLMSSKMFKSRGPKNPQFQGLTQKTLKSSCKFQVQPQKSAAQKTYAELVQLQQQPERPLQPMSNPTEASFILTLANSRGQVTFYNITDLFPPFKFEQPAQKGKLHRIKEKRNSFVNKATTVDLTEYIDLSEHPFTEEGTFVYKAADCGTINDYFYVYNDCQTLHVLNIYGCLQGEWNLNLNTPKRWDVYYNQINQVLGRLELALEAIKDVAEVDENKFKVKLLMERYLRSQDIKKFKKFENRNDVGFSTKKRLKSRVFSTKSVKKQSQPSMNQLIMKQDTIIELSTKSKQIPEVNIFIDKYNLHKQKNKTKDFKKYQELELFVKNRKTVQMIRDQQKTPELVEKQPEKHAILSQQLDQLMSNSVKPVLMRETPTQKSDFKVKRMQNRQTLMIERPKTSLTNSPAVKSMHNSPFKTRIKSSMTDLSKNFSQQKIQYKNFLQRNAQIMSKAQTLLSKKTKLKL